MLHVMVDYGSLKRDLSGLAKISYTQVYYLPGGGRPGPGEQMGSASYPVGCDAFVEVRELSALSQPRPRSASRSELPCLDRVLPEKQSKLYATEKCSQLAVILIFSVQNENKSHFRMGTSRQIRTAKVCANRAVRSFLCGVLCSGS